MLPATHIKVDSFSRTSFAQIMYEVAEMCFFFRICHSKFAIYKAECSKKIFIVITSGMVYDASIMDHHVLSESATPF